jgi:purine nucleoside phosphorylase
MEAAVAMDCRVWQQFAAIEAERIRKRLNLPENGGLDALDAALRARLVHHVNAFAIDRPDARTLIFTITGCRVQKARELKGMERFACRPVGMVEFPVFASTIDSRIRTACLSCPPDSLPGVQYCRWKFSVP